MDVVRRIRLKDVGGLARKLRGGSEPGPLRQFLESEKIEPQPLARWAAAHDVPIHSASDLNSDEAVQFARSREPEWIVYGGGGILRRAFLSGDWRVLNAHLGPLPEIRGMNAAEWAVLLKLPPAATIHLIDEGIDTGPVLGSAPIDLAGIHTVEALRQQAVVTGIKAIVTTLLEVRAQGLGEPRSLAGDYRQCFTLTPALKELVEHRLSVLSDYSR
jgi:methionyl-tRNA formyltransferase